MNLKKIYITLITLLLSFCVASADELTTALLLKRKIQTKPLTYEQVQPQVPDNFEITEVKEPQKPILQVFKPYEKQKDEVIFGSTKAWVNAIDPTAWNNRQGIGFPGNRGANQLIIYTPDFGERTNTNEFGAEAVVVGNTVTEITGADSYIPQDGVVISGHGRGKNWMNSTLSVGTKIYIDRETNFIYTYTTSESYIFETEKKISEAENLLKYYQATNPEYNPKLPASYIDDAKDYLKKAKKNPNDVQKYSQAAIDSANDALKSVLPYKIGEVKGIWLRPTETTEQDIINSINRIYQAGIDNIFIETYFHGKTIFPSKTMEAYNFTPQYETFAGIDPLEIWIREAHKRGIKVHTWFETFYVGADNPNSNPNSILAMNPSWGNRTKKDMDSNEPSKSGAEHNGYFLDPSNPDVQDFLLKLIEEIITRYKPDGINVDYIRYPNSVATNNASNWGYTQHARNDFYEIYGVDPAELKFDDPLRQEWNNYRRDQVTNMIKKIGLLGKKTNTYISAVIFPDRASAFNSKFQDWKTWSTRNYINGITPLFLTCDSKTAHKMMTDVINSKSYTTDFYAGLFVTFMGGSDEDLIRQIHEARKVNAKGVILFDYAHLNNKYINTLSRSVFARAANSKYNSATQINQTSKQKRNWKILFQ